MALNSELYIHPSDKAAMKALKAIPGFSQFVKAYMSVWNERQFRIMNMSSNLKISEHQLKKYYDMLPPICSKLGIDIPELFLELDVRPNAYTYGDTKPFIVITSGLFETLPDELIPTVLAHECGHIACHHTMYTTMGNMILNGVASIPGYASLVTLPLQMAFAYWMRCSELSADRAASIVDGNTDKMIEVCMRFAGYDKDIPEEGSLDAFMKQAEEYREMVSDSKWNKMLEFMMFNQMDHPLNAVRAYECREWSTDTQYIKICNYLAEGNTNNLYIREIPFPYSPKELIGAEHITALEWLTSNGYINIQSVRTKEKTKGIKENQVSAILIAGESDFDKDDWFAENVEITLIYYAAETEEEAIIAHQGKLSVPESSKKCIGHFYPEVVTSLKDAGFTNIIIEPQEVKKSLFMKDDVLLRITIAGQSSFEKGAWFDPDSIIRIVYAKTII